MTARVSTLLKSRASLICFRVFSFLVGLRKYQHGIRLSRCSIHVECLRGRSEMSTSVAKWVESLRNRVSIISRRYTDHMKFYCFCHIVLVLLCIVIYIYIYIYFILYIIYSYCYIYIFLLLCRIRFSYCVSLCSFVYCICVCVNWTVLLPLVVNPITFN